MTLFWFYIYPHHKYEKAYYSNLTNSSGPTDIGMSRLTLSDADKQARDYFVKTTQDLGCEVKIDTMGTLPFPSHDFPLTKF
jgi:hypothetical protein